MSRLQFSHSDPSVGLHPPAHMWRKPLIVQSALLILLVLIVAFAAAPRRSAAQTGIAPFLLHWSSTERGFSSSVAWGDVDGDGDLDLAVGNSGITTAFGVSNLLYRNEGGTLSASAIWSSAEADFTTSVAWGDVDGDLDLDLAVGNSCALITDPDCRSVRLYRNEDGMLTSTAVYSSAEADDTRSVAWGDVDGDGDLDLAVGNESVIVGRPNRLYRNCTVKQASDGCQPTETGLSASAVWSAPEAKNTTSVAWGDVDGDGDLDLAVGNRDQSNQLYLNCTIKQASDGCQPTDTGLSANAAWFPEVGLTRSVAWGDVDGDGDLDLAVGNEGSNRLYRNCTIKQASDGCQPADTWLSASAAWSAPEAKNTTSVVWGDVDGDGDLDLAVGNRAQSNQLYLNCTIKHATDGCQPAETGLSASAAWPSAETDDTLSVAWGDVDGDGDLDLAVGNSGSALGQLQPNRLYRNEEGTLATSAVWSSPEIVSPPDPPFDSTLSAAWGDVDGDGDLDLAVGNGGQPNRLYRNCTITQPTDGCQPAETGLSASAVYSSTEKDYTTSVAWGDADGDGNLDLAVGNACDPFAPPTSTCRSIRLYVNTGKLLNDAAVWSSTERDYTNSVAWGDIDGDGDLDLAVGNSGPNRLYRNQGGTLTLDGLWVPTEVDDTISVAWGDVDGDGDLDLAVGNNCVPVFEPTCRSVRLYRNTGGVLNASAAWSSIEADATRSVAWGDVDGDGDLDLAIGNAGQQNKLYRNEGGTLTEAVWSSIEADDTWSVAWGDVDGDGDLDLAAGNRSQPNRLYRNDGGVLTSSAVWSSDEPADTVSVAWGDADGDGDLDLAAGNADQPSRLYRNTRDARVGPAPIPVVRINRPGPPPDADSYSTPQIWSGPTIPFTYTLIHPHSLPVQQIIGMYSLDGGGRWLPAVAASGTQTTTLGTSPEGTAHTYTWDVFASGVMGRSDDVVFRLKAIPAAASAPNQIPGPYLYGSYSSATFPFRVRGNQVRVMSGSNPAPGALVYRLPAGASGRFEPYSDLAGQPFQTDSQGYLQGRGELQIGDQLVALLPITATDTYTFYYTSAAPNTSGLTATTVVTPGVQTLTVSPANPLVLFNLDVSLEWDARKDTQFITQLQYDLRRASESLYDWTNGQAALGRITIYHDRQRWEEAHLRIYASNRMRPNAVQGGIVTGVITDPVSLRATDPVSPAITYAPGQVRIGPLWNRYGDSGGELGEDWPRALAHELGHFALFLDDNYLGLRNGVLVPVDGCPGAMSDPYRDDYSEFRPDTGWLEECRDTLSNQSTGRSDWATITTFYPWLHAPGTDFDHINAGPGVLPLDITQIEEAPIATPPTTVDVPIFLLSQDGQRVQPGASARAVLFQDSPTDADAAPDGLVDLGRPTLDQVLARGARVGDRLCVYDLAATRLGCTTVEIGNRQLPLVSKRDWQPEVVITPVTSRTLDLQVMNVTVPPTQMLKAQLFPLNDSALPEIQLAQAASGSYTGTLAWPPQVDPSFEGYVRVWVAEPEPRREIVVDYALRGNPGNHWAHAPRGSPGNHWAHAPIISSDGQVILFGDDLAFPEDSFYALQAASSLPSAPSWATMVGLAYRITASANAPDLHGTSISFNYLGSEVPSEDESGLLVYFWDGASWQKLPTTLDSYHNTASARVQGPGLYALMSSRAVRLHNAGWNLFSYPVHATRPVTEALASIDGYYTTAYGYVGTDTADPWKVYDVDAPVWVNDLHTLEYGQAYWIRATEAITVLLKGGTTPTVAAQATTAGIPTPPATYYGVVQAGAGFTPAAGMQVSAWVNDTLCGQAQTRAIGGQIVYVVDVPADDGGARAGCGVPGRVVRFQIETQHIATTVVWSNDRPQALVLSPGPQRRLYLPLIARGS